MSDKTENFTAEVMFLNGILQKINNYTQHLDIQTNILVAISSAIFVLSASVFHGADSFSWPFFIMGISSGLSVILALFAVDPPGFMRKKGQKESIFYHRHITTFTSPTIYLRELDRTVNSEPEMVREFAIELFNLSKYSYWPKRQLFVWARNFLVMGFILSFAVFVLRTFMTIT